MQAVIKRIDGIIKELYQIQRTIKALSILDEEPKKCQHKQYVVYDEDGDIVMKGCQVNVKKFIGIGDTRFQNMLNKGNEYKGYTIDEVIEDDKALKLLSDTQKHLNAENKMER